MQLACSCMALSCGVLAIAIWSFRRRLVQHCSPSAASALPERESFVNDPISLGQRTQTRSGALHVLFDFAMMEVFAVSHFLLQLA